MSQANRLNLQRKLCRRELDSLWNLVESTKADPRPENIELVNLRVTKLPSHVSKYESCIISLMSQPDHDAQEEDLLIEFDIFKDDVNRVELLCKKPPFVHQEPLDNSTILNTAFDVSQGSFNASGYARLPELDLQTFNGDIQEWQSFHDIFNSVIHQNEVLSPVQKFQYLKSSLRGQPLQLIEGLTLTDANYNIALNILRGRYQRKRLISTLHIQSIINLPQLKETTYSSVNTFLAATKKHLAALKALNEPVDQWSKVLAVILTSKLGTSVRNKFEARLANDELPDVETLLSFLETFVTSQQWQMLEPEKTSFSTARSSSTVAPTYPKYKLHNRRTLVATKVNPLPNQRTSCLICKTDHLMFSCPQFRNMTTQQRHQLIKENRHCFNCLSASHRVVDCKSKSNCRTCNQRHHTLLHLGDSDDQQTKTVVSTNKPNSSTLSHNPSTTTMVVATNTINSSVSHSTPSALLSTALVYALDSADQWQEIRVLLDNGSETSIITESCRRKLNLPIKPTTSTISGISNVEVNAVRGVVTCNLRSRYDNTNYTLTAVVLKEIASHIPSRKIERFSSSALTGLALADPTYMTPGPIDMLLGADLYYALILGKPLKLPNGPYAVETTLGWVISGPLISSYNRINSFHLSVDDGLKNSMKKFWELEEVPTAKPVFSAEELLGEQIFAEQHTRLSDGRYVVPLLFKTTNPDLGGSFGSALACYRSLRTRLNNNDELRQEYVEFMRDYLQSGHMSPQKFEIGNRNRGYFIPHHCVVKYNGPSMKLRVVFNASKPSSNGVSLNDTLLAGPPLQLDLSKVVMRQRLHQIVITADIRQMFRQVLIPENQRIYQKILWDFDLSPTPQVFELNTVTYGTTCAPFVAIRTLHQLVKDEGENYPMAADALRSCTFVDDIITGTDCIQNAKLMKTQLIELLSKARMELRKWASNCQEVLEDIPNDHRLFESTLKLDPDHKVKILGVMWNPSSDAFVYHIQLPETTLTKRQLLSEAARIFDPLGWLSPVTIVAKLLIQTLWKTGMDWDDPLPDSVRDHWIEYKSQLPSLKSISIPRWIPTVDHTVDLIGFCDASEKGYAAVVYLLSRSQITTISLVMGKTKVAPIKQISLPRLELCAAYLLAQLVDCVRSTLAISVHKTFLWTDSTVTLAWIQSPSYRWKTFVANRVAQIRHLTQVEDWYHVRTQDNPADCASRGLLPNDLINHPLWWTGPPWLKYPISQWPFTLKSSSSTLDDVVAQETKTVICLVRDQQNDNYIFLRYSSFTKLLRISTLCLRFARNCRSPNDKQTGPILATHLHSTQLQLVRLVQLEVYGDQITLIQQNQSIGRSLRKLNPFIDQNNILRVGGRLGNSIKPFDQKHPILLPAKSEFTKLLVIYYHEKYLHATPRTLHNIIQRSFWIVGARNTIRHLCSKCVKCFRNKPTFRNPMMGDLPHHRVTPQKPFEVIGTDYGGPFFITPFKGRGYKCYKAYLCLFICFATKAVHLELVSDLSTETFLNAFRRMISRRGRCSHVYSDGGTNFVGAKSYFSELQQFIASTDFNAYLTNKLAAEGIQWHINPPSAPHFGGLWEAAIKSVKFHLARVIGQQILTYEEMATVFCQVEAILNSRPLCPLSTDPDDCSALTPSHFITFEPAVSLPEPNLEKEPIDHLTRWKLIQRVSQDFWRRWNNEYLNTLQQRVKWNRPTPQFQVGQLVLIKDNCLPPLQWKLGRIIKVTAGRDQVVRVATVKTATGNFVRPVVKLAPLPISPTQTN